MSTYKYTIDNVSRTVYRAELVTLIGNLPCVLRNCFGHSCVRVFVCSYVCAIAPQRKRDRDRQIDSRQTDRDRRTETETKKRQTETETDNIDRWTRFHIYRAFTQEHISIVPSGIYKSSLLSCLRTPCTFVHLRAGQELSIVPTRQELSIVPPGKSYLSCQRGKSYHAFVHHARNSCTSVLASIYLS